MRGFWGGRVMQKRKGGGEGIYLSKNQQKGKKMSLEICATNPSAQKEPERKPLKQRRRDFPWLLEKTLLQLCYSRGNGKR